MTAGREAPAGVGLRPHGDGAEGAAEGPQDDQGRQQGGLSVRSLLLGKELEEQNVDLVDDTLRQHREHRRQRELQDRAVHRPRRDDVGARRRIGRRRRIDGYYFSAAGPFVSILYHRPNGRGGH